jgi:20S proteasome subunit beta 6
VLSLLLTVWKVGDGLEVYVITAAGRSLQELDGIRGIQEIPNQGGAQAQRTFVIRRDLKKD